MCSLLFYNITKTDSSSTDNTYPRYTYKLSTTTLTNQDITFTFTNKNKRFISIKTPDNKTYTSTTLNYTITKNGTYKFIITYNDKSETITLDISNIDKTKPTGSCTINIVDNVSTYTIKASDTNGIKNYIANEDNSTYTTNTFKISKKVSNYKVTIYDKANNSNTITCTKTITNSPINKTSSSTIVTEYYSDTLRYWVETSGNYHITHIWVKDATKQVNTWLYNGTGGVSNKSIKDYANNLISKKGLENKGLVISNGSAFTSVKYSTFLWDGSAANGVKQTSWKNYSQSPLIISQGKVIKNFTNSKLPAESKDDTSFYRNTYVFSKSGWFSAYRYTINDVTKNKKITQTILDNDPIFTLAFTPILVSNYQAKSSTAASWSTGKKRNSICQIDENNFILMNTIGTKADDTKHLGTFNDMAKKLAALGCKVAYNLDGGGSTTEYTKKNTNSLTAIVVAENTSNGGRYVGDSLYFVEQ